MSKFLQQVRAGQPLCQLPCAFQSIVLRVSVFGFRNRDGDGPEMRQILRSFVKTLMFRNRMEVWT